MSQIKQKREKTYLYLCVGCFLAAFHGFGEGKGLLWLVRQVKAALKPVSRK